MANATIINDHPLNACAQPNQALNWKALFVDWCNMKRCMNSFQRRISISACKQKKILQSSLFLFYWKKSCVQWEIWRLDS